MTKIPRFSVKKTFSCAKFYADFGTDKTETRFYTKIKVQCNKRTHLNLPSTVLEMLDWQKCFLHVLALNYCKPY